VFLLLIVGVSYKLIPMFALGEVQHPRRAAWSVWLLNAGLAGLVVTLLLRSAWKYAFTLVLLAALLLYALELRAILRRRHRRTLDWGVKTFLIAVGLLVPFAALAAVLARPGLPLNAVTGQLENLYGFLGFLGIITLAILGMLYKVVPFLVWFGTYSQHLGRAQVPSLGQLYSEKLQIAGLAFYLAGLLVTSAGIVTARNLVVRLGAGLLAASLGTLVINLGLMARHYFRPQLTPFPAKTPGRL
jgi:hypothetical protein